MLSNRAAGVAVVTAFCVGLIASLALRPSGTSGRAAERDATQVLAPLKWRVPVSFQTSMPGIGDNPLYVAEMIRASSNGVVELQIFNPGEIVPAFSISDAVRDGKVAAGYTFLGYDQGKTPASSLIAAVPFGMEPLELSAWWFEGGGRELGEELYQQYNAHPIMCGMTGPETAGWFREPIRSLKDLDGLKIRFAGIGGKVIERLGASITMLPGGEIFQALEKGAIDATEFSLPVVDQSLGFNRIAKYNYYPGWHQPATAAHLLVNLDVWNALPRSNQKLLETACAAGITNNLARTEAHQGAIIAGFPKLGVFAETLPHDVLKELQRVAHSVMDEEAAKDEMYARILNSQRDFRANHDHWKRRAYLPRDF